MGNVGKCKVYRAENDKMNPIMEINHAIDCNEK